MLFRSGAISTDLNQTTPRHMAVAVMVICAIGARIIPMADLA